MNQVPNACLFSFLLFPLFPSSILPSLLIYLPQSITPTITPATTFPALYFLFIRNLKQTTNQHTHIHKTHTLPPQRDPVFHPSFALHYTTLITPPPPGGGARRRKSQDQSPRNIYKIFRVGHRTEGKNQSINQVERSLWRLNLSSKSSPLRWW